MPKKLTQTTVRLQHPILLDDVLAERYSIYIGNSKKNSMAKKNVV
jgi:hypothetical protein